MGSFVQAPFHRNKIYFLKRQKQKSHGTAVLLMHIVIITGTFLLEFHQVVAIRLSEKNMLFILNRKTPSV